MQIIKKEKDREVSFLIEGVSNPALYEMIFNPDYFETLGLKRVYGAMGGGGANEATYPYKYFHVLYDWMFAAKSGAKPDAATAPPAAPQQQQFQYPDNRMSLEALMESVRPQRMQMHPYDLREAPPAAAAPEAAEAAEPSPEARRLPETAIEELTESHPYDVLPEAPSDDEAATATAAEAASPPSETTLLEPTSEAETPAPEAAPAPAPAPALVFTFHKIGLVHGYTEYCEMKRRTTTDADIEHDADGKTKQELLGETRDAEIQAYYKAPLLKMGDKAEVQEAKAAEAAFGGEKVFMVRNGLGKVIMLDWRL